VPITVLFLYVHYVLDDQSSLSGKRNEFFPLATASRQALGLTQPPIQLVPGAFSSEVKRPGREADHSPPSTAEIKNSWSDTSSTPPVRVHGMVFG